MLALKKILEKYVEPCSEALVEVFIEKYSNF